MPTSRFILSLDFELHWGVFDHVRLDVAGKKYFQTTRELIPPTLELFRDNGIRATWATVGILFAPDRASLEEVLPRVRPDYGQKLFDPYPLIAQLGKDEAEDPYHYAGSLIRQIAATPGQEIGSHTFSHYYCLEPGQGAEAFRQDLAAARELAETHYGITLRSLVFPRNQFSSAYVSVLAAEGFQSYRTNPEIWFWRATAAAGIVQKGARLLDHYLPLDRDTTFQVAVDEPLAVPASRFFRPYLAKIDAYGGQALKLRRICAEMTQAARYGRDYHLWWHPHNLATHPEKNMAALKHILQHYRQLEKRYGMQSASMSDVSIAQPS